MTVLRWIFGLRSCTGQSMIKIKNIYYMLAYAFQILREDSYSDLASEEFEHIGDLFAAILAKGIANQIKRGMGKEYLSRVDVLVLPVGKIDISSSVKHQTMRRKQLVCHIDEYSENAYVNQILKATTLLLMRSLDVEIKQKKVLKRIMYYFCNVAEIDPRFIEWGKIKYHRNNATYKMLINICHLVIDGMLISQQNGTNRLSQFIDDQRMHQLYERFVLEYYRKNYARYIISASHIDWNVDDGFVDFLPQMKSDITISDGRKTLIIDTKYYTHTMQTNSQFDSVSLHSGNMYQIFTYVKNRDKDNTGNVSGLLLYAKTDEEVTPDSDYIIGGNRIGVTTLNLDVDFLHIEVKLNLIINKYFC